MSENQSVGTPTPSYSDFVRKLFNRSKVGDLSKDFTHAVLGVATEVYEHRTATDEVNSLEELGDLEFYVEAAHQVIFDATGLHIDQAAVDAHVQVIHLALVDHTPEEVISGVINELLDAAKRWVGYDKAPSDAVELGAVLTALVVVTNQLGTWPVEDKARIRAANMAKLLKRYPGGEFSQFHALQRDLEAERVVLQAA